MPGHTTKGVLSGVDLMMHCRHTCLESVPWRHARGASHSHDDGRLRQGFIVNKRDKGSLSSTARNVLVDRDRQVDPCMDRRMRGLQRFAREGMGAPVCPRPATPEESLYASE